MPRSSFIANHVGLAVADPWHGPSLSALLSDVSAAEAQLRPIAGAHTIAELAAHMLVWVHTVNLRLSGIPSEPSETEQWTPFDTSSEEAWRKEVARLLQAHVELAIAVRALSDERLVSPVVNRKHDTGTMLHGIIEHDAYHGGQIALLKNAIRSV